MFYQFNNFTGRLVGSNHVTPHFPVGVQPLSKHESPAIVYQSPHLKLSQASEQPVRRQHTKRMIPGTNEPYAPLNEALRKKMEMFQVKNDLPIHLKGGPMDRVLYSLTLGLCVVGVLSSLHFFYQMSYPKKK